MEALKRVFAKSKNDSHSLVLIDDFDQLCDDIMSCNRVDSLNELKAVIYNLMESSGNVLLLATSQSEAALPEGLLQHELLDKVVNLSVPGAQDRECILGMLLNKHCHSLSSEQVSEVSSRAHGFTGGDLEQLCIRARFSACERGGRDGSSGATITFEDFEESLKSIKPSSVAEFNFTVPNVKWEDIGGMEEVKELVREMVDWPLKYPEQCRKLGYDPRRGVLLYGPPGCSKTMVAKAVATESQINFINVELSGILNKYVGESEKSVSELFKRARSAAPCILFIDEIDAVAPTRGSSTGSSNVIDRVVSQLLTELDGIDVLQKGVCIIAATNRPDMVDPSLLRPGRFDCCIHVGLPDLEARKQIFRVTLKKGYASSDLDLDYLAQHTQGYSGAEIVQVCDEGAYLAIEESTCSGENVPLSTKHILVALTKVHPRTSSEMLRTFEVYNKKFMQ